MRKQILSPTATTTPPRRAPSEKLDLLKIATAHVSSEDASHPIECALDGEQGPGSTKWVADADGEQTLILEFDEPVTFEQVIFEVEEAEVSRTQELQLAVSMDGGQTYHELLRQEFNFAPPHTTFEREEWRVQAPKVTHFRLKIRPDKGGRPCRASVTALALI